MDDQWNPWHGCKKCSEGCQNCYMFYLDRRRADRDGGDIYRTKTKFHYPVERKRDGGYKVPSGSLLRVCMTSDFFLPEADGWRDEAWDMIAERRDVMFWILTKRPERFAECLPSDWGNGWENVILNVTAENQRRADERIPILLETPARHRGVIVAPFIAPVSIGRYLSDGKIGSVSCGGENYDGARPCDYDWVRSLRGECVANDVSFSFFETGTVFIKDGKRYHLPDKALQKIMAKKADIDYRGRRHEFILCDAMGIRIGKSFDFY